MHYNIFLESFELSGKKKMVDPRKTKYDEDEDYDEEYDDYVYEDDDFEDYYEEVYEEYDEDNYN